MAYRVLALITLLGLPVLATADDRPLQAPALFFLKDHKIAYGLVHAFNADRVFVESQGQKWNVLPESFVAIRSLSREDSWIAIRRDGRLQLTRTDVERKQALQELLPWMDRRILFQIDAKTGTPIDRGVEQVPALAEFRSSLPTLHRVPSPHDFSPHPQANERLFIAYLLMDILSEWPAMLQTDADDTPTGVNTPWYVHRRAALQQVHDRLQRTDPAGSMMPIVKSMLAQFDRTRSLLSELQVPEPDYGDIAIKKVNDEGPEIIIKAINERPERPITPLATARGIAPVGTSSRPLPRAGSGMTFSPKGRFAASARGAAIEMLVVVGVELGYEYVMYKHDQWKARKALREMVREHREALTKTRRDIEAAVDQLRTERQIDGDDLDFSVHATRTKDPFQLLKSKAPTSAQLFEASRWVPQGIEYAIYRVMLIQLGLSKLPDLEPTPGPLGDGRLGRAQLPYWEGADKFCRFESLPGGPDAIVRWANALAAAGLPGEALARIQKVEATRRNEVSADNCLAAARMLSALGHEALALDWLTAACLAGATNLDVVLNDPHYLRLRTALNERLAELFTPNTKCDVRFVERLAGVQFKDDTIELSNTGKITLTNLVLDLSITDGDESAVRRLNFERLEPEIWVKWEKPLHLGSGVRLVRHTVTCDQSSLAQRVRNQLPLDRSRLRSLESSDSFVGAAVQHMLEASRPDARVRKTIALADAERAAKEKAWREALPGAVGAARKELDADAQRKAEAAAATRAEAKRFREANSEKIYGEVTVVEGGWGAFETSRKVSTATVFRVYRPRIKAFVGSAKVAAPPEGEKMILVAPHKSAGLTIEIGDILLIGN